MGLKRKTPEQIAKGLVGNCTCGFLEGFKWNGKHDKNCLLKRIAKAIQDERDYYKKINKPVMGFDHDDCPVHNLC